jgi:hypothetical protein
MDRSKGWALLSLEDVAYKESYIGYSGAGHPCGKELVRYLQLFVHSYLWMHRGLMTSPKMGVERRRFYKSDLDSCPFVPFEALNPEQRKMVRLLSSRLIALESNGAEDRTVFDEIDGFFAGLYGLDKYDAETIRDTMETALPYRDVRLRACQRPTPDQRRRFATRLESSLRPFFRKLEQEVRVTPWSPPGTVDPEASSPYSVVLLGTGVKSVVFDERMFRERVLSLASESGASLVIFEVEHGLAIALLNQYRYWTPSRARLCAAEILRRHMAVFER